MKCYLNHFGYVRLTACTRTQLHTSMGAVEPKSKQGIVKELKLYRLPI